MDQDENNAIRRIPIHIESRRRRSRSSSGLIMAFLFGLAIGFSARTVLEKVIEQAPEPKLSTVSSAQSAEEPPAPLGSAEPPAGTPSEAMTSATEPATAPPTESTSAETSAAAMATPPAFRPGRYLFMSVPGPTLEDTTRALLQEIRPGGVVLLGANIQSEAQTAALVREIKKAVGMGLHVADPPLVAVDQEGGAVNRLKLKDAPSPEELGRMIASSGQNGVEADDEARRVGRRYAEACRARGIGLLFAPSLDIAGPDTSAEMRARCFGDENGLVLALGLAFAQGAAEGGAAPIVKHYPGMGSLAEDPHQVPVALHMSTGDVARVMYPFFELVARGVPGVMAGHVAVPALDKDAPDRPASVSPRLITEILRDGPSWKYDGAVIADDVAMKSMTGTGRSPEQASVEALVAGCDAVILCDPRPETVRSVCAAIAQAAQSGALSKERLAQSARRLDALSAWLRHPQPLSDAPLPISPAQAEAPPMMTEPLVAPGTPTEAPAATIAEKTETSVASAKNSAETPAAQTVAPKEETAATTSANATHSTAPEPAPAVETYAPTVSGSEAAPTAPSEAPALSTETPVAPAETSAPAPKETPTPKPQTAVAPPPNTTLMKHVIKEGETLFGIARQYGVRAKDIQAWNSLAGETIVWGRTLKIYVKADANAAHDAAQTVSEKTEASSNETLAGPPPNTEKVIHVVTKGETLSEIAAQYGVRQKDVVAWNGLKNNDVVKYDSKLIIYRPAPPATTP